VPPVAPRTSENSTPREEKSVKPAKPVKPFETVDNHVKSLVSTVLVKRPSTTEGTTSKNNHDSDARKEADKAQHQRNSDIDSAMGRLASLSNDRLKMSDMPGTGGGGPGPVNYRQAVLGAFDDAWNPPAEITDNVAVAVARITVHRSGKITDARIIKVSNNALMDRSVQNALEAVKSLPPFPQGATDLERVFNIEFNLKAKRATG
jgi:TonB family protein